MKRKGVYIPSIEGKDVCVAGYCGSEYSLKTKTGSVNLRKFINSLDYSLDLPELSRSYRRVSGGTDLYFEVNGKRYTQDVVNVTFKYSVKEWNKVNKTTYIKRGYDAKKLNWINCIAYSDGIVVGVQVDTVVQSDTIVQNDTVVQSDTIMQAAADTCFRYDEEKQMYKAPTSFPTVKTCAEIREDLYENGFICDGKKYVRFKRSAGSARVGKCLFIAEPLYKAMFAYASRGLEIEEGQEIDLAAFESYISLPLSSCIDTISLKPENILVVNDYESIFTEDVIATRSVDGKLQTAPARAEIANSIWDGLSLIDVSAMGKYSKYGMILLRNLMFKSDCFNSNLQQWFTDNGVTDVSQLNGRTRAERIEDIKLITTPSSIKYLKFGTLDMWFDNMYDKFGIVKHDKKTHFFEGHLVQTHYQLLNTLQLSKEDVREFLGESLEFAKKLRADPAVVRYYIKYPEIENMQPLNSVMTNDNEVVYNLLCINDRFCQTKYYRQFLDDLLRSYYKRLKNGKVLVNGNYSTLLGNPIELLREAIGRFDGSSQIGVGNIHSTRFEYGKTLLGSRSPHVTISNVWLPKNTENEEIDKYLNLTDEIVCVNSIGENTLQRLSGAD